MSVVAALLSILLFLVFATSGLQKVRFNPLMSQSAGHLGFTKSAYQRIGLLEILGAFGLLAGLSAYPGSFWGVINWLSAAGLTVTMVLAVRFHLKAGDKRKDFTPAMALGLLALIELVARLAY